MATSDWHAESGIFDFLNRLIDQTDGLPELDGYVPCHDMNGRM